MALDRDDQAVLDRGDRIFHAVDHQQLARRRIDDARVEHAWDDAFGAIGGELRTLDPDSTVLYSSGRASLETSYLYALFARLYGHDNLPDSSNMCHETTSVGLKKVIASPVGTSVLNDFNLCDAIFFGQNRGPTPLGCFTRCRRR